MTLSLKYASDTFLIILVFIGLGLIAGIIYLQPLGSSQLITGKQFYEPEILQGPTVEDQQRCNQNH